MQDHSKRDFLKATGAATALSMAGCLNLTSGGGGDAVTFWGQDWEGDTEPYADWFKEQIEDETGETFELTEYAYADLRENVLTGGRTGTPDVMEGVVEHPGDYVGAGLLEPMTDKTNQVDHFDGFVDAAVEAFRFQDELWALPWSGNGRGLIYRKDVLTEYGYEEGPPSDAEEFMELAGAINESEEMNGLHLTTERGEIRTTQEFLSHVYQHADEGLYTWDGDGWALQANASDFEGILDTFYYGLFHGDNPACSAEQRGAGWEANDQGYARGDHAMIHCGPWVSEFNDTDEKAEILNERTAVALLPKLSGASDGTYLEVKPVMVNAHSDNTEAAVEAAALFSSPEALKEIEKVDAGPTKVPVHEDVESSIDNEDYMPFNEVFANGVAPAPIKWGPVREAIYDAIETVIYEESDPATAASDLEQTLLDADVSLNE